MSQDAYSPLLGRWGVEGFWDIVLIGLAVVIVALGVFIAARSRRERSLASVGAVAAVAASFGVRWVNDVRVDLPGGRSTYCALSGQVDGASDCGGEYLWRYSAVMVPMTLVLALLLLVLAGQVRRRLQLSPLTTV